jgi:hypothetical protein
MSCGSLPAAIPAAEKARNIVVLVNFRIRFQTAARSRPPEMMTGSFMKYFSTDYPASHVEAMRRQNSAQLSPLLTV